MLRAIWSLHQGLFGFDGWIDPEDGQTPDSGHGMDPDG